MRTQPTEDGAARVLLFVRGCGTRSLAAMRAVRQACALLGESQHALRIIDVFNEPTLVEKYRVVATPTLLTLGERCERRLVGDLSEQTVLAYFEAGALRGGSSNGF